MALSDVFGGNKTALLEAQVQELSTELTAVKNGSEILSESLADVILAYDNNGWNPMGEELDMHELPLYAIKKRVRTARALGLVNPIIKRGINVRTAYIWGNGVEIVGLPDAKSDEFLSKSSTKKYLTSSKAYTEMESCLATDGNFFLLVTKGGTFSGTGKAVQRIPFTQITGTVSNPDNHEEIWFYRREWSRIVNNTDSDAANQRLFIEYIPAVDYELSNGRPRVVRTYPVRWDARIAHHAVNKQVGWLWGIPDLLAVIDWAKAHKEFLENQAALVKALSRFAWKVGTPTVNGAKTAATKVGAPVERNPYTGEPNDVGSTFVGAGGATLSAVGRSGGSVDFKAGQPLAAYVAAGLDVPLNELTADAGDANRSAAETLSSANEKVMKARQDEHKMFLEAVYGYLGYDVVAKFPPISEEDLLRFIQALIAATPLNLLSDDEVRPLLLKVFDVETTDGVPTKEDMANLLLAVTMAAEQADKAAQATADAAAANAQPQADSANPSNSEHPTRTAIGQHAASQGKDNI